MNKLMNTPLSPLPLLTVRSQENAEFSRAGPSRHRNHHLRNSSHHRAAGLLGLGVGTLGRLPALFSPSLLFSVYPPPFAFREHVYLYWLKFDAGTSSNDQDWLQLNWQRNEYIFTL
ncbi:unnamed protein product [Cuscuta campestris]|uniref:Uncharacterized protein n=1 Tax=Cuscuta campestris TaxID=132261 RepID=A0A484NMQ6_9ASTE|nr:unnamed protein product [Cuscuta campestris]